MKFPLSLVAIIYLLAASCAHSFERTTPKEVVCRSIQSCGKLSHCYIHLLKSARMVMRDFYNYVGGKDDVMQNVKVTLSPPTPRRLNSNLTVTIDAYVSEFL